CFRPTASPNLLPAALVPRSSTPSSGRARTPPPIRRRWSVPPARAAHFLFDVPERYTPQSRVVPAAVEVAPWVETIIRLWGDEAFYAQERRRCLAAAEAWRPERLLPRFEEFLPGSCAHTFSPMPCLAEAAISPLLFKRWGADGADDRSGRGLPGSSIGG